MSTPETLIVLPPPPDFLRPNFEGMPMELRQHPNWVVWVTIWNGTKWTKRPIQPSGYGASSTNPKHWSTFDAVKQTYEAAVQRGFIELRQKNKPPHRVAIGGVGFVFDGQPDPEGLVVAGVDFDHVISSAGLSAKARERIQRLGSYVERSVSGTGLHVILKARLLQAGVTFGGVELYTSGRFFTMTGCPPESIEDAVSAPAPLVAAADEFAALAEDLRREAGRGVAQAASPPLTNVVPFQLPDWAINGRPAAAFAHLKPEKLGDDPDIDKIRSAFVAIPSSVLADETEWTKLARTLAHEAAVHTDYTEHLWNILEAASRTAPGYNQQDNRDRFLRYIREAFNRPNPITIATLFHVARDHGWNGGAVSDSVCSSPQAGANTGSAIQYRAVHISNLPLVPSKRQWLHGTDLVRGAVTLLVAPGGRAKSTWLLACALACASGRDLLGSHVFGGPLRVLCLSTEDGLNELALRLRAAMTHFKLVDTDVPGLHVVGADRWGLPLLKMDGNRAVLDDVGMSALAAELDHVKPDVLILDPLINLLGGVDGNNNAAAALLMRHLVGLAITRQMAVALAHHVSKGRDPASAESAMGAASLRGARRPGARQRPLPDVENVGGEVSWRFPLAMQMTKQ